MKKTILLHFIVLISFCELCSQFNPDLVSEVKYREIGPYRGGRSCAVAGVPKEPNLFPNHVCQPSLILF